MVNNIEQFKIKHPDEYKRLMESAKDPSREAAKYDSLDDLITNSYYDEALKENPDKDYIEFYREFNPLGRFASIDNFKDFYSANPKLGGGEPGRVADRMYNALLAQKQDLRSASNINLKDYKDFIFQMAPRFKEAGSRKEGIIERVPQPYTTNELTEFTGSLVGTEENAIPTNDIRAMQSLSFKRDKALTYLQQYVYDGYTNSGGELSPEARAIAQENKFLRQNAKTGALEFYNPKANNYQLVNMRGLDVGDVLSLTGDVTKIITETIGAAGGFYAGRFIPKAVLKPYGKGIEMPISGAGALYGAYKGGYYGSKVGELIKASIGNMFFPGLNPDVGTKEGRAEILQDNNVIADAEMAQYFSLAGPVIDKLGRTVFQAFQAGRLLTKKDFSELAENAEEAQLIADEINGKLQSSQLKNKLKDEKFFFGTAEATADPETIMYLNVLENSDLEVGKKLRAFRETQQQKLSQYFDVSGDTFTYKNLTDTPGNDPATVVNKVKEILAIRKNTQIGKFQDDVLKKSQKTLDEAIEALPNQGRLVDGSYIRTAIGDAQKKLDDEFEPKFEGMMETAEAVSVNVKPIMDELKKIKFRESEEATAFRSFLPVEKLFAMKPGSKLDGKYLIQTMQDLKAYDRKMRTGAIAAETSEQNVRRLIKSIQDAFAQGGKESKAVYQKLRHLNLDYYNKRKLLNNTLSDLVSVRNGKVKIQDSDLFLTSFTARTGGYKERLDEIYNVLKDNPEAMSAYRSDILNFYRREVIDADGKVNLKKHKQFISSTDKGGYGYGLKKFFGDENVYDINKIGGLQKQVDLDTKRLQDLIQDLRETTAGKVESLNHRKIVDMMFDGEDPTTVQNVMKLLNRAPDIKKQFKTVMADKIKNKISTNGAFDLIKFNSFFKPNEKNSPYQAFKIVYKDDPNFIKGIDTIHKALQITARGKKKEFKDLKTGEKILIGLLRARVGIFTPEGRALTAIVKLAEGANKKSFANIITDPEGVKKIASLNKVPLPDNIVDPEGVVAWLKTKGKESKIVSQFISQTLGDSVTTQEADIRLPKDLPKATMREQINMSLAPTDPNINLFAGTPNIPLIEDQPQEPVVAQAPPRASGIGALNPQAQAANFAGLFPEDNLGQAIAQRGNKIG